MLKYIWVLCLLASFGFFVSSVNVTFEPSKLEKFRSNEFRTVLVKIRDVNRNLSVMPCMADCADKKICQVMSHPIAVKVNNLTAEVNLTIGATFLGVTDLIVQLNGHNYSYSLRILRSDQGHLVSKVFTYIITVFIGLVTFMMGTQLKLVIRQPIGPCIGFVCQFGLMPMIGFLIAYYGLSNFDRSVQLALYAVATCPGGGKSSFWTIIFNGNLDLSICMTFFQTLASMVMMPLWLRTLGSQFMDVRVTIPFIKIISSLAALSIPTITGMLFTHFRPQYVEYIQKWIKRISWTAMFILTIFAIYTHYYMLFLINAQMFIMACALPWLGYFTAFTLATILRQDFNNAMTIAIETGIQNVGIAIVLIKMCLPEPESDISLTIIFVMAIMTDKPLVIIWGILRFYRKFFRKDMKKLQALEEDENSSLELKETNDNSMVSI